MATLRSTPLPAQPDSNAEAAVAEPAVSNNSPESENPAASSSAPMPTTTTSISTTTPSTPTATNPASRPESTPAKPAPAVTVMAWLYPGKPACSAASEMADGRTIHVLKPEYFTINGGTLERIDATTYCNGYSPANVATVKRHSTEQYVTVSSASTHDMETFLRNPARATDIAALVSFVVSNDLTGIELDFEDFGSWSAETFANYKQFVTELGTALHAKNKKLMLDGPAIRNNEEQSWFTWRYADFKDLPVDYIVVMTYDYQYDHGAGEAIAPLEWMKQVLTYVSGSYPKSKLVAGIPSYGYEGRAGTFKSTILTAEQLSQKPGFETASRDPRSHELTWQTGNLVYFYQDTASINAKISVAHTAGIDRVSIWHLGGNPWLTN